MSENLTSPFPNDCAKHPGVAGTFPCSRCGNHFCIECCYSLADGTISCHDCYSQSVATAPVTPSLMRISVATPQPTSRSDAPVLPGQGCIQHPQVFGIFTCQFCGAKSCTTCNFFFPPDINACPQCASTSSGNLSPVRKKNMIGGLISGGIATAIMGLGFATIASGGGRGAGVAAGGILLTVAVLPAAVGAGLAMAAFKKGRSNSIGIWLALIWNFVMILSVVGLVFVGLFMRGR